jgi:hypothetical protein
MTPFLPDVPHRRRPQPQWVNANSVTRELERCVSFESMKVLDNFLNVLLNLELADRFHLKYNQLGFLSIAAFNLTANPSAVKGKSIELMAAHLAGLSLDSSLP